MEGFTLDRPGSPRSREVKWARARRGKIWGWGSKLGSVVLKSRTLPESPGGEQDGRELARARMEGARAEEGRLGLLAAG